MTTDGAVHNRPFTTPRVNNRGTEEPLNLEEELLELTTNEELKVNFKNGYQEFWLQKSIPVLYPGLWAIVQKFLIAFPSSYMAERRFSAVANLLSKKRIHITERGDLGLMLTKLELGINKLLTLHQPQPSH